MPEPPAPLPDPVARAGIVNDLGHAASAQLGGAPPVCTLCGDSKSQDGWPTANRDYFCKACWTTYQENEKKEKEKSGAGESAAKIKAKVPLKVLDTPELCTNCGETKAFGWKNGGTYFCKDCWAKWHELPVPEADEAATPAKRRRKKFFAAGFGDGCGCCYMPRRERPEGVPEGEEVAGEFSCWGKLLDIPEYRGLEYIDSHCHLDCIFQKDKNGGPGWDSMQRICRFWKGGMCNDQSFCAFAHGEDAREERITLVDKDVGWWVRLHSRTHKWDGDLPPARLRCVIQNCCEIDAIEDTRFLLDLGDRWLPNTIFVTFGCHPHSYRDWTEDMESRMLQELERYRSRCVAWGECGLDYCKNYAESLIPSERAVMVGVFARQARIAVRLKLPLVVHARDADEDTLAVFRDELPKDHKVHVHAFQGSITFMNQILDLMPNSVIGISGMVTLGWPVENVVAAAKACPLDRLVLETDAPYLATGPVDVPSIAAKIAQLKGLSPAEVLKATTANSKRFYGIVD